MIKYTVFEHRADDDVSARDFEVVSEERNNTRVNVRYSRLCSSLYPKYRGKLAASIADDGNRVRIRMKRIDITLDYSQLGDLMKLLEAYAVLDTKEWYPERTIMQETGEDDDHV